MMLIEYDDHDDNIFTITKFIIEYTQHHMEKNLNYNKRWWEKNSTKEKKRKQIKISIEQKKRNKKQNRREQKRIEQKGTK